jgi:hypothetical protein
MLVICTSKTISNRGFTYGRLYRINHQCGGYSWVTNDKGVIIGEVRIFFETLTDWKKYINKENVTSL